MHFRGRNRDGQGDASSPDGGIGNDNGAAVAAVDEEALTLGTVELTRQQQQHDENEEQQELVVQVPTNTITTSTQSFVLPAIGWELSEEAIALRREAIHIEVERVQRANFIHFLVLCLVPTALLIIVVAAIVSKGNDCGTVGLTTCEMEPRSFTNAFTSACICDAVRLASSVTEEEDYSV